MYKALNNFISIDRINKFMIVVIKIFFVGLILQFFLHTFVTFQLGLKGGIRNVVRAWKEILVMLLGIFVFLYLYYSKNLKKFLIEFPLNKLLILFFVTIVFIFIISFFYHNISIGVYLNSIRYAFAGFVIFFIFFAIAFLFLQEKNIKIIERVIKVIKYMLIMAIIWWGIIWLVPRLLEFAGYDKYVFEGNVGANPPTTYYTHKSTGYVRNQFLFERPITWGFFLIAFWPLFFVYTLRHKGLKTTLFRGTIYSINIISTFSRAAWIAWIVISFFIVATIYRKNFWRVAIRFLLPLFVLLSIITYFGRHHIINRDYSNTGHIIHLKSAIEHIKQNPIWGLGAGSAGPTTFQYDHIEDYNTENQYLQIWVEYGIIGFMGWFMLYLYLHRIGYLAYLHIDNRKTSKQQKEHSWIIFALSLGLLGLSIEGLVLHSFVDRMVVYPFCAIFGIAYGLYKKKLS